MAIYGYGLEKCWAKVSDDDERKEKNFNEIYTKKLKREISPIHKIPKLLGRSSSSTVLA